MKKLVTFLFGLVGFIGFAQAPANYYSGTEGLTKEALKTKLSEIISQNHNDKGYGGLYTGYKTTDTDIFYEKDNSVLDMYSENPQGTDSYFYKHGQKQCGQYSSEGDCYNREHIIPQSLFSERAPMRHDIHFVVPSDGKVNGVRSNHPFGVVTNPSFTSKNGSKLGNNTTSGFSGTVFEPIDEFKGDIARMIFYFVTRYESQLTGFKSGNILDRKSYPGITKWQLDVLLAWHNADPVSEREISRNNAAYKFQGNRNPYIDNPNWVAAVWGGASSTTPNPNPTDTVAPSVPTGLKVTNTTASSISLSWTASTDNVAVTGYDICIDGNVKTSVSGTSATISGLNADTAYNFTVVAKDAANNKSNHSAILVGKTDKNSGTTPPPATTSCGTEDFENIPAKETSYKERTWTNNNITWTATDARTDQTLNGKAILIRNGNLTSSKISGGIGSVTVTTKLPFKDTAGNLTLNINGKDVGTIPYSAEAKTTTIENINIDEDAIIIIKNSTKARVVIDDLSWTCYTQTQPTNPVPSTPPTTNTPDYSNVKSSKFTVTPNPVTNKELYIHGLKNGRTYIANIYSIQGHLVQRVNGVSNNSKIQLKQLTAGVYIIKINGKTAKFIVE